MATKFDKMSTGENENQILYLKKIKKEKVCNVYNIVVFVAVVAANEVFPWYHIEIINKKWVKLKL